MSSSMSRQFSGDLSSRACEEVITQPVEELASEILEDIVSDALWLARDDPITTCWIIRSVQDLDNCQQPTSAVVEQLPRALVIGHWRQCFQNRWLEIAPCVASLCPRECIVPTANLPALCLQCKSIGNTSADRCEHCLRVVKTAYPCLVYFTDESLSERVALRGGDRLNIYFYTSIGGHVTGNAVDDIEWTSEEIIGSAGLYAPPRCDCDEGTTSAVAACEDEHSAVSFLPPTNWTSVLHLVETVASFMEGCELARSLAPLTRQTWTWCINSSEPLMNAIMKDRFRLIDKEPLWWTGACEASVDTLRRAVLGHPLVPPQHEQLELRRIKLGLASAINECLAPGTAPIECLRAALDRYEELLHNGFDATKSVIVISLGSQCVDEACGKRTIWESVASKHNADAEKLLRLLTKSTFRHVDSTDGGDEHLEMEMWWREAHEGGESSYLDARVPAIGEAGFGLLHYRRWRATEACRAKFPQVRRMLEAASLSTMSNEKEYRAM